MSRPSWYRAETVIPIGKLNDGRAVQAAVERGDSHIVREIRATHPAMPEHPSARQLRWMARVLLPREYWLLRHYRLMVPDTKLYVDTEDGEHGPRIVGRVAIADVHYRVAGTPVDDPWRLEAQRRIDQYSQSWTPGERLIDVKPADCVLGTLPGHPAADLPPAEPVLIMTDIEGIFGTNGIRG